MRRALALLPVAAIVACSSGGTAKQTPTTATEASPTPLPSASLSGFDAARLSIACDQTLIASKEDTAATRDRDVADAASGFRAMTDPLGAQLAVAVEQANSTAFAYVLAICTANGASPTP